MTEDAGARALMERVYSRRMKAVIAQVKFLNLD